MSHLDGAIEAIVSAELQAVLADGHTILSETSRKRIEVLVLTCISTAQLTYGITAKDLAAMADRIGAGK